MGRLLTGTDSIEVWLYLPGPGRAEWAAVAGTLWVGAVRGTKKGREDCGGLVQHGDRKDLRQSYTGGPRGF